MTDAIWKFPLNLTDEQAIEADAWIDRPLHVGLDPSGILCLWCEVSTRRTSRRTATVHIIGTGNLFPVARGQYVGSVTQGSFVWHVYVAGLYDPEVDW